jgi:hypothetical protein
MNSPQTWSSSELTSFGQLSGIQSLQACMQNERVHVQIQFSQPLQKENLYRTLTNEHGQPVKSNDVITYILYHPLKSKGVETIEECNLGEIVDAKGTPSLSQVEAMLASACSPPCTLPIRLQVFLAYLICCSEEQQAKTWNSSIAMHAWSKWTKLAGQVLEQAWNYVRSYSKS